LIVLEFINVKQLEAYQACSEYDLDSVGFEEYCADVLISDIDFWIWNEQDKRDACTEASDLNPESCEYAVAILYAELIEDVLTQIETLFQ